MKAKTMKYVFTPREYSFEEKQRIIEEKTVSGMYDEILEYCESIGQENELDYLQELEEEEKVLEIRHLYARYFLA